MKQLTIKRISQVFRASILIKGIDGLFDIIGGITLFLINSISVYRIVEFIFSHELAEDPADFLGLHLLNAAGNLSSETRVFSALYLTVHGSIKVFLATAIWRNKFWAFPIAGIVLVIFISYQIFRLFHTHSIILFFLTLVDLVILALLRFEYKQLVKKNKRKK